MNHHTSGMPFRYHKIFSARKNFQILHSLGIVSWSELSWMTLTYIVSALCSVTFITALFGNYAVHCGKQK